MADVSFSGGDLRA